jgi:hypothetical protein
MRGADNRVILSRLLGLLGLPDERIEALADEGALGRKSEKSAARWAQS